MHWLNRPSPPASAETMDPQDACNRKSNHQHLGTIQSSNLCTEIVEYTDPGEVAVCNLGSVVLPKFVSEDGKSFDHQRLFEVRVYLIRGVCSWERRCFVLLALAPAEL